MANCLKRWQEFRVVEHLRKIDVTGMTADEVVSQLRCELDIRLSDATQLFRLAKDAEIELNLLKPKKARSYPSGNPRSEDRPTVLAAAIADQEQRFQLLLNNLGIDTNIDTQYKQPEHLTHLVKQIESRSFVDKYSQALVREES